MAANLGYIKPDVHGRIFDRDTKYGIYSYLLVHTIFAILHRSCEKNDAIQHCITALLLGKDMVPHGVGLCSNVCHLVFS